MLIACCYFCLLLSLKMCFSHLTLLYHFELSFTTIEDIIRNIEKWQAYFILMSNNSNIVRLESSFVFLQKNDKQKNIRIYSFSNMTKI